MEKKFSVFSVFSLLLCLVIVLSACGGNSGNSNSSATGNQQSSGSNHNEAVTDDKWPEKSIRIIVPFSPGGATDTSARIVQPYLEEAFGVNVIIENKPGGGGELGTTEAFHSDAEGYTILVNTMPEVNLSIAKSKGKTPYKATDFVPIVVESIDARALFVKADSHMNNLQDFINEAKANPGKLSVGVIAGGTQEVFARWLFHELDIDVNIVGFDNGSEGPLQVIGGHIDAALSDDQGRYNMRDDLKALAIADFESNDRWPEAKPFHEQGVNMPVENFLARHTSFFVKTEFKEKYPERYKKLQDVLLSIPNDEAYQQKADELGITDTLVWAKGEEYVDSFNELMTILEEVLEKIGM